MGMAVPLWVIARERCSYELTFSAAEGQAYLPEETIWDGAADYLLWKLSERM